MKVVGATMNRRAFKKLWRLSGAPTLDLIPPISTWTLADGLIYDARRGQFMQAGKSVPAPWTEQSFLTLPFLAQPQQNEVTLNMPGVTTTPKTTIMLDWSPETAAALQSAWGVGLNGRLYRVTRWALDPLGVSTPNSITVDLLAAN